MFNRLRILEIGTSPAIAYCGLQFARWGAEVIAPRDTPMVNASPMHSDHSLTFAYLYANKSLTDDVASLIDEADVVLTDQVLTTPTRATVHVISSFPDETEMVDHGGSLISEALSGFLSINGDPDREPVRMPGHMVAYITGVSAFLATLAAFHKKLKTGRAETIHTSELDTLTTITPFVRAQHTGEADKRQGGPQTGVRLHPIGDGFISHNLYGKRTFAQVLETMGLSMDDVPEHLQTPKQRYDTEAFHAYLKEVSREHSAEAVFDSMMSAGLPPMGLYQTPASLPEERHLKAIDYFQPLEHPSLGTLSYPGGPAKFSSLSQVQPAFPEDKTAWTSEPTSYPAGGSASTRPLEGIRIIDFTQAWIGPYATMLLADLGAEVIKIESHKRVDVWRNWPGELPADRVINDNAHPLNVCPNFNSTNRNKREIAIDLTQPDGLEIARALIATADVVIDNYTPRVMSKFALDHRALKAINPNIISVAWSGYGKEGPYTDYKANGTTTEAISGWDALFGYADGNPMVMGFYQADAITGLHMAACTALAILQRDLTGEDQAVSGSMVEAAVGYIGEEVLFASAGGTNKRHGNAHPDFHQNVYRCQGDDEYVAVMCLDNTDWANLCRVCNASDEAGIRAWIRKHSRGEAVRTLQSAGVPVGEVLNTLEILQHRAFTERGWFQEQFHADVGDMLYGGFPWTFSDSTLTADYPPPRLGEHSREILADLGYEDTQIESLLERDIVGCVIGQTESA